MEGSSASSSYCEFVEEVTGRVSSRETLVSIAADFQRRHRGSRGFSLRSLERFCRSINLRARASIDVEDLDEAVSLAIRAVGHTYGRRMLQGTLRASGVHASQRRISLSMQRLEGEAHAARQRDAVRLLNPLPYIVRYHGHKLHLDQNEKIGMFGCTYVVAVDGYSREIVGLIALPKKNAVAIYEHLFRPLLLSRGIWDQVRVDHGREFDLILSVQDHLMSFRHSFTDHDGQMAPYVRTESKHNLRAERFWEEVNDRVTYPIKAVLCDLVENGRLDDGNGRRKFFVSVVTIKVAHAGAMRLVSSWNAHTIPGRTGGIPLQLAADSVLQPLNDDVVPSTDQAIEHFEAAGGSLTTTCCFGVDPLEGMVELQIERERWLENHFHWGDIFSCVLQGAGHTVLLDTILTVEEETMNALEH